VAGTLLQGSGEVRFPRHGVHRKALMPAEPANKFDRQAAVKPGTKILDGNGESIEAASQRIKINANYITALVCISFLAPDIVEAILNGRHPVTLTAKNFATKTHLLPRAWSQQRRHLGF
jgi:hypothetical protein